MDDQYDSDDDLQGHEIRKLSSAEYYTRAGFKRTVNRINNEKSEEVRTAEAAIRTNRTTSMTGITDYINSTLEALEVLTAFYGQENLQGLKLLNYQGRQKMDEELINIFINGGTKYKDKPGAEERLEIRTHGNYERRRRRRRTTTRTDNGNTDVQPRTIKTKKWKKAPINNDSSKVPVVVFGDARFGRNNKGAGALADKCRRLLKKADNAGRLVHINMDEYLTSQICSKCGCRSLSNDIITGPEDESKRMYTVLTCTRCNTVW
ncbi:uncharacterized protein BX664DRAFT_332239, partial [Halteromyces radiatus]|uniref:uncharacterized protein n=1 Tax=Halteromyces radiatus TaxID=101107 RepID=UPI0022205461